MRRLVRGLPVIATLALAGCGVKYPPEFPLAEYTRQQLLGQQEPAEVVQVPNAVRNEIADILYVNFRSPEEPVLAGASAAENERIYAGSRLYQVHCIHCHGMAGGGDGPTAPFLFPRPRDYRRGTFKWKSTVRNDKPTRQDLASIIQNGAIGSSMPPFRLMAPADIDDLVEYVIFLSKRGELERRLLQFYVDQGYTPEEAVQPDTLKTITDELKTTAAESLAEINTAWSGATDAIVEPAVPMPNLEEDSPEYAQSLERGKALYLGDKAACYKCHNKDGQADPAKMADEERKKMFDDWLNPNYPRNLRLGMYRGGRRPIDLYRRIHEGISGASMPEGGKALKPEEIWDLVRFVRAIPYRPDLLEIEKPVQESHGHGHDHATTEHGGE